MEKIVLAAMFAAAALAIPATHAQTYTVLYNFKGSPSDGSQGATGLAGDAEGNLYGAALSGGATSLNGVVFRLNKNGETILHNFTGGVDGAAIRN